uniref:hypothetical protein n=1 Tax=Chryseobacterium sp. TaxID=1871047 RepID=UPI00321AA6FB
MKTFKSNFPNNKKLVVMVLEYVPAHHTVPAIFKFKLFDVNTNQDLTHAYPDPITYRRLLDEFE